MPDQVSQPVIAATQLHATTQARLEQLAASRHQSPDMLVREAVEQYVDREEKRQQFQSAALESWEDYKVTGLHVTEEEVFAWFGRLRAGERVPPPECHL